MKLGSALLIALALSLADADERPALDLLVVVGVPPALEDEVRTALDAALASMPSRYRIVELGAFGDSDHDAEAPERVGRVVALGADACERLAASGSPLICALLSAEAFAAIPCAGDCDALRAIVADQPLSRQVAVANAVYPALGRFGVLSGKRPAGATRTPRGTSVVPRRFDAGLPLPAQLNATLASSDALVAQPESAIFNRSTLHVVLLTAYGYGKPVIGYSRAYVGAGALISTYSTPAQIVREALDWREDGEPSGAARTRPPARFSIVENRSVARSLGLVRRFEIEPGRDYSDADFPS